MKCPKCQKPLQWKSKNNLHSDVMEHTYKSNIRRKQKREKVSLLLALFLSLCMALHLFQFIPDGYASHLSQLEYNQRSRPAKSNSARMVLRKGSFGWGAAGGEFLRKRNHIFRTISSQQPGGAGSASPNQSGRTERTLSQCEMERERGVGSATQRSMSIAAGCWGRSGSTKEGSGGLLGPK